MRFVCQVVFLAAFRLRTYGRENVPARGGVLLVCNHQSFLDPMLVTLALKREGNYMARDTLFANPLFRKLITTLNAFPVKRGTADVGAIKEIIRRLRDGKLVVVFPEATRTYDGSIAPFQEGALLVAKRAACAIVPTLIDGAFRCWPRRARFPRPGKIRVRYGQAIPAEVIARTEIGALNALIREALRVEGGVVS